MKSNVAKKHFQQASSLLQATLMGRRNREQGFSAIHVGLQLATNSSDNISSK
jgi:hypothetical protein